LTQEGHAFLPRALAGRAHRAPGTGRRADPIAYRERQFGFFTNEAVEAYVDVIEAELGRPSACFGIRTLRPEGNAHDPQTLLTSHVGHPSGASPQLPG
jgi:hypothetical protein